MIMGSRKFPLWLGALGVMAFAACSAMAGNFITMYGDADGFGFGAPQDVDGALWRDEFGGTFFTDYRDPEDLASAPNTDHWDGLGSFSPWTYDYALDFAPTAASLRLYIAGFADIGAVSLVSDGSVLTTFNFPGQFQTTHVLDIPVPLSHIDGSTTFSLQGPDGDGCIIDYARLTIVPEPTTLVLVALTATTALFRRRR
jgi:hypothetical protein